MHVASFDAPVPSSRRVSVEAYLAAEATAFERHEFLDGLVRAMPSASSAHVLVTAALGEILAPKLRKKGVCRMLDQEVQV